MVLPGSVYELLSLIFVPGPPSLAYIVLSSEDVHKGLGAGTTNIIVWFFWYSVPWSGCSNG